MIELRIDIDPRAWQSFRIAQKGGKYYKYKPNWVKEYQSKIWKQAVKQIPENLTIHGPIRILKLIYFFKTKDKKKHGHYKLTKPDLGDNLNKPFFDAISGTEKPTKRHKLIEDDSLIVEFNGIVQKLWSESPGIYCQLEEITNME